MNQVLLLLPLGFRTHRHAAGRRVDHQRPPQRAALRGVPFAVPLPQEAGQPAGVRPGEAAQPLRRHLQPGEPQAQRLDAARVLVGRHLQRRAVEVDPEALDVRMAVRRARQLLGGGRLRRQPACGGDERRGNQTAGMLTDHRLPPDGFALRPIVTPGIRGNGSGWSYNRPVGPGCPLREPACGKRGVHASEGFDLCHPNGSRGSGRVPLRPVPGRGARGGAAAAAHAGGVHRRAGRRGTGGLPAALRKLPRREPGRWPVRPAAARHGLPREVVHPLGRGAVHRDGDDDAAGPAGLARRRDLHRPDGLPAAGERHRGRHGAAAGRPGGHGGAVDGLAIRRRRAVGRRRPAAGAGAAGIRSTASAR